CTTSEPSLFFYFFFQAEDGIRARNVTGVQTCALPILSQDTSFHYEIGIPGEISLPNASTLKVTYIENREKESEEELVIPVEHVVLPLHIRTRKPGDRMSWRGLNGSKKIKDIFIDEKIPLAARNSWPLVVDDAGQILWLIGLKKRCFSLSKSSSKMIKLMYLKNE